VFDGREGPVAWIIRANCPPRQLAGGTAGLPTDRQQHVKAVLFQQGRFLRRETGTRPCALGGAGAMYPERVPDAAALLAEYGPAFEQMEEQAWKAVKDIRYSVQALSS